MKMKENNHELCRKISSYIYHLRNSLNEMEKSEPSLFSGEEPHIRSNWEFWTTDEILETIQSDIERSLINSERIHIKENEK